MDHRAVLASFSDADRAALTVLSDRPGLVGLAWRVAALALTGVWIGMGWPGWWAVLVPHGVMLIFLFTLLHETSHFTAFRSRWLNRVVGAVCGVLVLVPPVWFRYFHAAHHRHTQDPVRDPELFEGHPEDWRAYVRHVSGLPTWRAQTGVLVQNALGKVNYAYLPAGARGRAVREARAMLALYAGLLAGSAAMGWGLLFWIWLLPALIGQPFLRLYLLAEHGRCPYVADMLRNTRTTFTNRAVRWLAWNMPYHAEHHAYPAVPFFRLPELHARMKPHLNVTERGYTAFNRRYLAAITGDRRA